MTDYIMKHIGIYRLCSKIGHSHFEKYQAYSAHVTKVQKKTNTENRI